MSKTLGIMILVLMMPLFAQGGGLYLHHHLLVYINPDEHFIGAVLRAFLQ